MDDIEQRIDEIETRAFFDPEKTYHEIAGFLADESAQDNPVWQRCYILWAQYLFRTGEVEAAAGKLRDVRNWLHNNENMLVKARFHRTMSGFYRFTDGPTSLAQAELALLSSEYETDPSQVFRDRINVASGLLTCGKYREAADKYEALLVESKKIGIEIFNVEILNNLIYCLCLLSDGPQANKYANEFLAFVKKPGNRRVTFYDTLARAWVLAGKYKQAEKLIVKLQKGHNIDFWEPYSKVDLKITLARIYRHQNKISQAHQIISQAIEYGIEHNFNFQLAEAYGEQAELYALAGQHELALESLRLQNATSAEINQADRDFKAQLTQALEE